MSAFDLLLTITLDTDTLRYSIFGSSTYDYPFEARIKSVGDITRSVSINGGSSPVQSISVDLDDADGELRTKKANTTFKRRVVTLELIDLETGNKATVFKGKVTKVSPYYDSLRVYAYDDTFDKLNKAITLTTSPDNFTNIPQETPNELIPIPLGTIDSSDYSAQGHCPAYLVDPAVGQSKYRYVAAQIALKSVTAVYTNGNLVDPADYTISYVNTTTTLGTILMTYIDFDNDQRDVTKSAEVTYDCTGLTDDGTSSGNLITNPAKAIKYLLDLRGIVDLADFGSKYDEGEAAYDDAGITIRYCATKTGQTWLEMIDEISESLNLQFFVDKDGSYAITFDDAQAPSTTVNLLNLTDSENILQGSFSEDNFDNSPASTMDFRYAYDFARGSYDSGTYYNYSDEQTLLGEDIRTSFDMIAAGSVARAKKMAQIKLFQTSVERLKVGIDCVPMTSLDLMDRVLVTHYSGSSSTNQGFEQKVFRVYGIAIRVSGNSVYYTLDLVDNPGVTLDSPSDTEPTRQDVAPSETPDSVDADPIWALTDYNTISWSSFTLTVKVGANTTSYSFNGSNTDTALGGAMAADTIYYVYADLDVSSTELQVSSLQSDTVGPSKVLFATGRAAPSAGYSPMIRFEFGVVTVDGSDVPQTIGIDEIPPGTIVAAHIVAGTITSTQIDANTIVAANIVAGTITANEIANATITGSKIANATITASNIVNSTITGAKIASSTITGSNIAGATITVSNIANSTITGAKIASSTITGSNISATTITADNLSATIAYTGTLTIKDGTTEYCGMTATGSGDSNVRIWAGDTYANRATAPFRVTQGGTLTAIGATFQDRDSSPRVSISSEGTIQLLPSDSDPGTLDFGSVATIFCDATNSSIKGFHVEPIGAGKTLGIGIDTAWSQIKLVSGTITLTAASVTFGTGSDGNPQISSSGISAAGATVPILNVSGGTGSVPGVNLSGSPGGSTVIFVGANKLGFFGASSISKPTVSGSRGGNAALTSLLTALSNFGLLTDSTT